MGLAHFVRTALALAAASGWLVTCAASSAAWQVLRQDGGDEPAGVVEEQVTVESVAVNPPALGPVQPAGGVAAARAVSPQPATRPEIDPAEQLPTTRPAALPPPDDAA